VTWLTASWLIFKLSGKRCVSVSSMGKMRTGDMQMCRSQNGLKCRHWCRLTKTWMLTLFNLLYNQWICKSADCILLVATGFSSNSLCKHGADHKFSVTDIISSYRISILVTKYWLATHTLYQNKSNACACKHFLTIKFVCPNRYDCGFRYLMISDPMIQWSKRAKNVE